MVLLIGEMDYTLLKKHCERARHLHLLSEPVTAFSESENNGDVRTGGLSETIAAILFANDSAEDAKGAAAADSFYNRQPLQHVGGGARRSSL
jgi:hypothetical protein